MVCIRVEGFMLTKNKEGNLRPKIYQYKFEPEVPMLDVETSLVLSVLAVESLKGKSRLRLEADYNVNRNERTAKVSAGTEVGESIARIFTGFIALEFGGESFKVEMTPAKDHEQSKETAAH